MEISSTREREREQSQALQCAASAIAAGARGAGLDRSVAAGRARQGGRQGDAVAEVAIARCASRGWRQQLRVDKGWERAVETVLGSYLEAVCVDGLDSVTDLLASFDGGHLAVVSTADGAAIAARNAASLQAKVQGATRARLGAVGGVYGGHLGRGAQAAARGLTPANRW